MICATLDVGSNSILLHIAEKDESGNFRKILDKSEVCKLGEGLSSTGSLSKPAMDRSLEALKNYSLLMENNSVDRYAAVGTMALRIAKNSNEFLKRVLSECGIEIEVIKGEEEARLSYLAVTEELKLGNDKTMIFDVGGGSTEFIFGSGKNIFERFSVNIGTLRFTEKFLLSDPIKTSEFDNADNAIKFELEKVIIPDGAKSLIGMGGTVTNVSSVTNKLIEYNPDIVQGALVSKEEILKQIGMYSSMKIADRKNIPGLQPKRADVILAGVMIINRLMEKTGLSEFIVSDRGIRHGLLIDRFGDIK